MLLCITPRCVLSEPSNRRELSDNSQVIRTIPMVFILAVHPHVLVIIQTEPLPIIIHHTLIRFPLSGRGFPVTRKRLLLEPLTAQPPVEEVKRVLGLVHGHHVASLVDLHEGEVSGGLDLAVLLISLGNRKVLELGLVEALLAGPLESLAPSLVAEPVADEVGITGIDQDRDLLEDTGDETVERLHPVTLEEEVAVDIKVAAVIALNLDTESIHDILLVQVVAYPPKTGVAEVATILALSADVIDILASALIGANELVVTVDGGRNARPDTAALVAVTDERLATRESIVHAAALALAENGRVATLATGHGAVVLILGKRISQAVADHNRLEVDVAVLVGQNLGSKDGDIVASIRLASNVEILLSILGELVEEEGKESVDILAGSNSVANSIARVRVSDVDRLVKENNASVVVPGPLVVDNLELLVNGRRAELEEETGERRAAGATVQPQNDGVVLRIVARLEEPWTVRLASRWLCLGQVTRDWLTVKQVLIVLFVIKVAAVLLDLVDAKLGRIDRLDAQVEVVELAANLTMLLAVGALHPNLLDIGALDDVVPVLAALSSLGLAEPGRLIEGILRNEELDLVPKGLGLRVHAIEGLLEALKSGVRERVGDGLDGVMGLVEVVRQDMLGLVLERSCRRGRRGPEEHG